MLGRAGLTMLIAVGADQLTKAIVRGSIEPTETVSVLPGLDFVRVANDGVAFGLFDELSSAVLVVIGIAFIVGARRLPAARGRRAARHLAPGRPARRRRASAT